MNVFGNRCYGKPLRLSCTEHRTNQTIADELGTHLKFSKKQTLIYFGHVKIQKKHWRNEYYVYVYTIL